MLEKYHVAYPCCSYFNNIDLETAMVFHGCPNVESILGMGVPRLANIRFNMGLYCPPQGGEGLPHVIMLAMDVGIGQYLWSYLGVVNRLTVSSAGPSK
jgi:hypothetical protein